VKTSGREELNMIGTFLHGFAQRLILATCSLLWLMTPVAAQPVVSSVAEPDYPPLSFQDDQGRASGMAVELLQAVVRATGGTVSFEVHPWHRIKQALAEGRVDVLPLVGRTPEREKLFDFTLPYLSYSGAVVVRTGYRGIASPADLPRARLGTMRADNAEEYLRQKGLGDSLTTAETFRDAFAQLRRGEVDAVVVQEMVAHDLIHELGPTQFQIAFRLDDYRQDFCFAVTKGDLELLDRLNQGLSRVFTDGTYGKIRQRWLQNHDPGEFLAPVERITPTPDEQRWLQSHQEIPYAAHVNWLPYEGLAADNSHTGIISDYLRLIERKSGVVFRAVPYDHGPHDEPPAALPREITVVAGEVSDPILNERFLPVDAFINDSLVVVMDAEGHYTDDLNDVEHLRVAVSTHQSQLRSLRRLYPGIDFIRVASVEQGLSGLSDGRLDVLVAGMMAATRNMTDSGFYNLKIVGRLPLASHLTLFVDRSQHLLHGIIEKSLSTISADERKTIEQRHAGRELEVQPDYRLIGRGGLALLLLVSAVLAWNYRLRREITARRQVESQLLDQRRKHEDLISNTRAGTWEWHVQTGETGFNERWAEILGYSLEELAPLTIDTWLSLAHPGDLKESERLLQAHFRGETDYYQCEARMRHKDGHWVWVMDTGRVGVRGEQGEPLVMSGIHQDISRRKLAESAAEQNRRELQTLVQNLPGMAFRCRNDEQWTMEFVSDQCLALTGYTPTELTGNHVRSYEEVIHPDFRNKVRVAVQQALELNRPYEIEYQIVTKNQTVRWVLEKAAGIQTGDGACSTIEGFITDISELRATTETLREREKELRDTQRIARIGSWRIDLVSDRIDWTDEVYEIYSVDRAQVPRRFSGHHRFYTEESWSRSQALLKEALATGGFPTEIELEIIRGDDSRGWVVVHPQPQRGPDGDIVALWGAVQDISERKRAERDREQLEVRAAHARKMETVGQLSGAIAHDFNNLLGIILGNLELLQLKLRDDNQASRRLTGIQQAADRAAELTRQLLDFSRREAASIQPCNLNAQIETMRELISRSLTPAIRLELQLGQDLWVARINTGEFQDALLNLITNSRDAMPEGGTVTLATRNLFFDETHHDPHPAAAPGEYVMVVVSDTGPGIATADAEHIFEPFFTTKSAGKGTGLGLSTVYGFMQRCGGHVTVDTAIGAGTSIHLYFPRYAGQPPATKVSAVAGDDAQRRSAEEGNGARGDSSGGLTILAVDDEPLLLDVAREHLRDLGYRVLMASNGNEALSLLRSTTDIDLLFSDVIMPGGISGIELAKQAIQDRSALKVLLASGYSPRGPDGDEQEVPGLPLLKKPYTKADLAREIQVLFDQRPEPRKTPGSIHWDEAFSSGDPLIDAEQQALLDLHNRLIAPPTGPADAVTPVDLHARLQQHAEHCFQREEALMDSCDYGGLANHRQVHRILLRELGSMAHHLPGNDEAPQAMAAFIRRWWFEHSRAMDGNAAFCRGQDPQNPTEPPGPIENRGDGA
jgi:hemerythrin-like metal-binding protein/PAS domain S-box-containing protein